MTGALYEGGIGSPSGASQARIRLPEHSRACNGGSEHRTASAKFLLQISRKWNGRKISYR